MQNLTIIGNLGDDAKQVDVKERKPFLAFSVACTCKNKAGESMTQWYNCRTSNLALLEHLTKGKKLHISGRPDFSTFTDKDGVAKVSVNVSVDRVELI